MSERQKASYPTAPIAWMSQAYDTTSSPSSPSMDQHSIKSVHSQPTQHTSTITSLESFERPESPTLPPERDLPLDDASQSPPPAAILSSAPTTPTRYHYMETAMPPPPLPPNGPFYSQQTMDKINQDPPLPPAPNHPRFQDTNNTNTNNNNNNITPNSNHSHHYHNNKSHHNHHQRKITRNLSHMSDQAASNLELSVSPNVPPAPAAGMYWSRAITFGRSPSRPLRAHSSNMIGEHLYIFGGCDMKTCFNSLYVLDMDTLIWSRPRTVGHVPPPCRAHSCTTVEKDLGGGKKSYSLYVFGGGDGPNYFNDLYVLNVDTLTWTKPKIEGEPPSPRRAHTTCIWNQKVIIVGGGDGARALADVHTLDVSDPKALKWSLLKPQGSPPIARGYHTSNLVKDKLIVYGGSDGHECFSDVHVLDLVSNHWSQVDLDRAVPRLAHSATQVGSYVFVVGGHDGSRYSNEVLLLNLVTMSWESRKIYGEAPSSRGYHTAVLHDSRLYIIGGYDGRNVYDDVYMLELSACAYLPQITNFEIDI